MMGITQAQFDDFLREYRQDRAEDAETRGRLIAGLEGFGEHLTSVSKGVSDVRTDLSTHKEDQGAHGLGTQEKAGAKFMGWIGVAIAVGGAIISLASLYLFKH